MKFKLEDILKKHQKQFSWIVSHDLNDGNLVIFDFTSDNKELDQVDLNDEQAFNDYIFGKLKSYNSEVGIGRYNEDRVIYKRSTVFGGDEARSVHLGLDIWSSAGTEVFAPIGGEVHSFKNNNSHGDYGPTIVLRHELESYVFYTLYGHLSAASIEGLQIGQEVSRGQQIATLGDYEENVHWPPHLHFQLIRDINDYFGDYPGVAPLSKKNYYLNACPDPNLILGIDKLHEH